MRDWLSALHEAMTAGQSCVLVGIVSVQGSTPRELGAKITVTAEHTSGTIGGGRFEYECIEHARAMLQHRAPHEIRRFSLGPSLGQCCGGVAEVAFDLVGSGAAWVDELVERQNAPVVLASAVDPAAGCGHDGRRWVVGECDAAGGSGDCRLDDRVVEAGRHMLAAEVGTMLMDFPDSFGNKVQVLLEYLNPHALDIVLFGAGHVGKALVSVLTGLPCHIDWIDSRPGVFPADLPANVNSIVTEFPEYRVDAARPGAYFLVMTHSHPLDQMLCERILSRNDFRYCGLIGSKSKRKKFEKRFLARGVPAQVVDRLTCPIGIEGISGKLPAEIAIAVAAQLVQLQESKDRMVQPSGPQRVAGLAT